MKILLLEDDRENSQYLEGLVASWGYEVEHATDGVAGLELFGSFCPDVILTDLQMPRMDGLEFLTRLHADGAITPAIVMTAFGSLDLALRAIHELGAFWFVEKPVAADVLQILLERASHQSRLALENIELKRQLSFQGVLDDIVGQTPAMQEIFGVIRQVAPTSAAVLITGESGTGKELVARAIHRNSRRAAKPFLALNCAALPETLIESELFGHERGAFTGAVQHRAGCLEQADGGTLFLDELGEMPLPMQAKLLRVLEDCTFRRLGGKQELKSNVRFLAATNQDPLVSVKEKKLREDLYYRLNVFRIHLPALRERMDDLPLMVEHMIERLNQKHDTHVTEASSAFLQTLQGRRWEGNVRELRNVVERAVILAGSGPLKREHLVLGWSSEAHVNEEARAPVNGDQPTEPAANEQITVPVGSTIEHVERLLIEATLPRAGNNKTKAARILGISTKTLHAKLNQYRGVPVGVGESDE